jgi:pimeloyl-ACP methyl ester carboxylesterase
MTLAVEHSALAHLREASRLAVMDVDEVVLPADRQCIAGRTRLHYLDWGTAGRPPLLFLHGGCLTAHTWDLVCLALRGTRHCLALDQRGHGDSEWSPEADYHPAAHLRDVEGWTAHLGCERPVLVGQSMGALNTLQFARTHGDRLAGIVLIDIAPGAHASPGAARIRDFTRGPSELDSVEAFVERALAFNPRRHPVLLRQSLMHNLRALPSGGFAWKYDRRLFGGGVASFPDVMRDLCEAAATIACPTLVIRGAQSDVVGPEDARAFTALFPRAKLVEIEDAGHTVQGDNPRALVAALQTFLAALD